MSATTPQGYNTTSIIVHWLTAIFIVVLFLTGEGRGAIRDFHIAGGAILGIFLVWRVGRRMARGTTEKSEQNPMLNLLSSLVMFALLGSILVTTLTGYLLPWTHGSAIDIFGLFQLPSPMNSNHTLHEIIKEIHEIFSHLFIPLVALHIVGTLKHHFIDKDGVTRRMIRPVSRGR